MKKNTTTLLIVGALAVGGYFAYKNGMFGKKAEDETPEDETPEDKTEGGGGGTPSGSGGGSKAKKDLTAILDIENTGKPLSEAINKAKTLVEDYRAGKVVIKTPAGQKDIIVRRKSAVERAKRQAERKAERRKKQEAKAGRFSARRKKAKEQRTTKEQARQKRIAVKKAKVQARKQARRK